MSFNFNIKETSVYWAVKNERLPILRLSGIFKKIFFTIFIFAIFFFIFSFFDLVSGRLMVKLIVLFFCLYLFFLNLNLFSEHRVKRVNNIPDITDALNNFDSYNLAQFLDFDTAKIFLDCVKFCKKRKINISSTAFFYSAIKLGKDVQLTCSRLGIVPKAIQNDIKNYLEKNIGQNFSEDGFSDNFRKLIESALKIAIDRKKQNIGEKEILVALSIEDEFFKKILVNLDLKKEDVENLTLWLDSAERMIKENKKFWTYENLLRQGSMGKDFASGYTITLDRFSVDWRRVVSDWRAREIIGHQKETEQVEMILAKTDLANALIIGNPGTGRRSIIEAIAKKCYLGTSLPELNNKRVVELDAVLLAAQIPDFEKLEATLDQIFSEVIASGNVILVINDLENFVGNKREKAGSFDISGILSKYLSIPSFQFIGITSYEGLHKNIEKQSSFAEMFEKVEVSEVSEAETINILQSDALELEYKYKILILYPSIREIVNLTSRYMPSLPFPKKALNILKESVVYIQKLKEKVVLPHHIAEIVSKKTEIPVGKMEVKEKETLLNLEKLIHNRIVNQEEAVNEISIAMRRARMGIASKTRPMGSFLFLGPTGVGKTETAKALAHIYFGSEQKMIRLDMSEFQSISDIPRLIGSTSPVEIEGLLTTPVRETPFSLILLDEIEKAHPNILNLFLQVLDEGHITDGQGRKVVFTNTIIICTSNAGADIIFKKVGSDQKLEKDELLGNLFEKNIFKPEFINRFDSAVIFHPLSKDNLLKIAQLSLQSLKKNLKEREIDFSITEGLKEKIVEMSYKPEYGAREMRRVIQNTVENTVAKALLSDQIKKGDTIEVDPNNFEVIVNPSKME